MLIFGGRNPKAVEPEEYEFAIDPYQVIALWEHRKMSGPRQFLPIPGWIVGLPLVHGRDMSLWFGVVKIDEKVAASFIRNNCVK